MQLSSSVKPQPRLFSIFSVQNLLGSVPHLVKVPHKYAMSEVDAQQPKENPLTNIFINVLIPVIALGKLSTDPNLAEEAKFYHLGPMWALGIALAFPIGYGLWFLSLIHI